MWAMMTLGIGLLVSRCLQGPLDCMLLVEKGRQRFAMPVLQVLPSRSVYPVCRCLWCWTRITSVQTVASMLPKLGSCDAPDLQWDSSAALKASAANNV